jgi:hypothetical protein
MASRDLTTTFQERRAAANMRRRKAGNGGIKPFGAYIHILVYSLETGLETAIVSVVPTSIAPSTK